MEPSTVFSALEVAQQYTQRGWSLVPVPYKTKKPVLTGWQKLRLKEADLPRHFNCQPQNLGLLSAVNRFGYSASGDLTHVIAPDGGVTTATYSSGLHQLLSTVDPVGRTQSFSYDSSGNMLTSTDGAGYVTTYAYNSRGLTTSVTLPDPDGAGTLTSPVTSFAYDSYGRLLTVTNPDSSTRTFTYNSADQTLTSVDELGKTESITYDSLGRPISSTNRVSATTAVSYDAMSRMLSQTDALGNVTDYEYNNRGWLTKVTYPDPDGSGSLVRPVDTRTYDVAGNQLTQGEAASLFAAPLTYTYDADNRRTSKSEPTSSSIFEVYGYDNTGRATSISRYAMMGGSPDRTVIEYDSADRVIRQSVQSQPLMGAPTVYAEMLFAYNLAGELVTQTDGRGYSRSWTYNSRGLVATETLPDADGSGSQTGLVISHSYDNMGRETATNDGYGRLTSIEYNNRSWVTKVTRPDPDGAGSLTAPVLQYGYNVRGDSTSFTDALGNVTTATYDDAQRLTSVTYADPDGSGPLSSPVVSQTYNAANWVLTQTGPLGSVTTNTYDNLGRILTQTAPDPDGSGSLTAPVTTYVYANSGLSKVTDPMGHDVSYTRDTKGRVAAITDAGGNVTSYSYDYYNNLTSVTGPDPDGSGPLSAPMTVYGYDSQDRLTSKTDPLGGNTSYTYDVNSNLTSLQDPEGNTTQFAYDGQNRLVLSTNSLSKSKSYTFDMAGNLARTSDRNGRVIQYQYDALGRQTAEDWQQSSTIPSLSVGTTQDGGSLDEQQSIGWSTTAFGMSGTYTITQNGQTTSPIAWNASAATIQSALEGLSSIGTGNVLVTVSSPNTYSRTINLTFRAGKGATDVPQTTINVSGLMPVFGTAAPFGTTSVTGGVFSETQTISLTNASGGTWRVAYGGEISGPLSPSISAADLKTVLDGFTGIDSASVTGSSGSFTVTFGGTQTSADMSQIFGDAAGAYCGSTVRTISTTYDANDQVLSQSDPSATINYTLDNLGRATTISNSISGLTPTVSFTQAFDAASNRTELKATVGSTLDFKNTYQYDALNRLVETVQQAQSGGNAVTSKRVTQSYNSLSQRTALNRYQSTGTSNQVASSSFSYDTVNRLSGITHQQGSTTLASYAYTYDGLSRIASINSAIDGLSTFAYDVSSQLTGADHTSQTDEAYDYDDNGNRDSSGYTVAGNNRTTAAPGFTYTYDDEGNRTSRTDTSSGAVQEYTWDYRNRLTKVVDRGSSDGAITQQVDYEYDANNRMVKRVLDADGAGSGTPTTQYWAYDEGINALLEFDGSSASDLSHRYLWSEQVDELFSDEQVTSPSTAGNTLWALSDHLGSIRDIADYNESTSVTTVANHRTMTATGTIVAETNSAVDLLYGFTGKQLDDATGLQHNLFRWYDSVLGQWLSEDPMGFAAGDENLRRYVGHQFTAITDPSGLDPSVYDSSVIMSGMHLDESFRAGVSLSSYFGRSTWSRIGDQMAVLGAGIGGFKLGSLQGGANFLDVVKDDAIPTLEQSMGPGYLAAQANGIELLAPLKVDLSRGRFTAEAGNTHDLSKSLIGAGMLLLVPVAMAKLPRPGAGPINAPVRTVAATADDVATLKSIRRHVERLAQGKVVSPDANTMMQVRSLQRHIANKNFAAAGTRFHSLNFKFAREAQSRGGLRGLNIDRSIPTPGGFRPSRRPDYLFDSGGIFDLKPTRSSADAYDTTQQFRDIFGATGNMPIPLYYRLWVTP